MVIFTSTRQLSRLKMVISQSTVKRARCALRIRENPLTFTPVSPFLRFFANAAFWGTCSFLWGVLPHHAFLFEREDIFHRVAIELIFVALLHSAAV